MGPSRLTGTWLQSCANALRSATAAALVLICSAPLHAQTPVSLPPGAETVAFVGGDYDPRIDPAPVLDVAKAVAKASGRRILVEVGGDWCAWCHILDDFVSKDIAVQEAMVGSFVVMKVYWGFENQNKKLLGGFPKAPGYPHFYVLDADGKLLDSQPTEVLEQGKTYDSARFIAFARKWAIPG